MNNGLDRIHIIDRALLSEDNYLQSLLEQAHQRGLISDGDIERLQFECLSLLANKTERYSGGDSSSIRVEKAQDIMESIFFTIGLCLKAQPAPDDAVALLKSEPVSELYQKGRRRINTLLAAARTLHARLLGQLVDTENVFYRATIRDAILGFFKVYYPDYAAQEIHITADYPLFNPMPRLKGIEFIKAYITAAYLENQFCRCFSAGDIHHLLRGYAGDYSELPINIYEQVLLAAIGCVVAGRDCARLNVTGEDAQQLCRIFAELPKSGILEIITKAAGELKLRFGFSRELERYVSGSLPLIAGSIESAARVQALGRIFFATAGG